MKKGLQFEIGTNKARFQPTGNTLFQGSCAWPRERQYRFLLKTRSPYIAPTLFRILASPSKPPRSLMTGATPLLPHLQKHPAQQTQTYSDPSVWRLLFSKCLKLFSKRRCLSICPNFFYWRHDSMVSSPDAQPWPTSSRQKNWLQNCSTKGVRSTWSI